MFRTAPITRTEPSALVSGRWLLLLLTICVVPPRPASRWRDPDPSGWQRGVRSVCLLPSRLSFPLPLFYIVCAAPVCVALWKLVGVDLLDDCRLQRLLWPNYSQKQSTRNASPMWPLICVRWLRFSFTGRFKASALARAWMCWQRRRSSEAWNHQEQPG